MFREKQLFSMFIAKKYIRLGKTIFEFFICGGISSHIRSEITFYGSADASQNFRLYIR